MEDDLQYAMQLATASVLPMTLKAAIELGVFEIMERAGPLAQLSPSAIASQLATCNNNPDAPLVLDRILSLLASHSILTCSQDKSYGLAPVAKYFIRNQRGGTLSPFLLLTHHKVMMDIWYHLKDAVLEGGPLFDKAHGMSAMEYMGKNAEFAQLFQVSMKDFNPLLMERILETYDGFEGLESLVDVGGGDGSILNMIVSKYSTIKGINYDLAPVIANSPSYQGVENVAGDMFVSVPKGDAIFIKWVLHMWDDVQCIKILRNCFEVLPAHGKVIAVDMVLPEIPEANDVGSQCLLQFYLLVSGTSNRRKERTEREFQSLAKEAGFSRVRVACCACNFSVLEFIKDI